jgi:uncharacterized membrane protein
MDGLFVGLVFLVTLGSGMMAGLFFAFSNVVMAALSRLDEPAGIAAMQTINKVVLNRLFFLLLFGTALLSFVILILAALGFGTGGTRLAVAGAFVYLFGVIVVTAVFNLPLNHGLARVRADAANAGGIWRDYLDRWVKWNHLRTASGATSLALFSGSLLQS